MSINASLRRADIATPVAIEYTKVVAILIALLLCAAENRPSARAPNALRNRICRGSSARAYNSLKGYGVMIVIVRPRVVKAFIPVDQAFLQMTAMPLFQLDYEIPNMVNTESAYSNAMDPAFEYAGHRLH